MTDQEANERKQTLTFHLWSSSSSVALDIPFMRVVRAKLWGQLGWKDGRAHIYCGSSIRYHDTLDLESSGQDPL